MIFVHGLFLVLSLNDLVLSLNDIVLNPNDLGTILDNEKRLRRKKKKNDTIPDKEKIIKKKLLSL